MKRFSLILLIVITLILALSNGYFIYRENRYLPPTTDEINAFTSALQLASSFTKEPTLSDEYFQTVSGKQVKMHAWMPTWAMKSGLRSLEAKKDLFDSVSPVYYSLANDGKINVDKTDLETLQQITQGTSIKIIPSIAGFEPGPLSIVLNDEEKLNRHVEFLLKEVDEHNFDGIDLDYEAVHLKDKDKFYTLLDRLSKGLHKRNKILTIAVLSKWGDSITYGYRPETREVQNYTKLAEYVDQIRIMAYDYTSSGSNNPGPIAPLAWVDSVLSYAVKRAPAEKIVLGVHLYGYAWPQGESARALDYGQVGNLKREGRVSDTFYSDNTGEGALRYTNNGKTYFAYYASPETVQARIDLANKYGIQGVAYWRLGDDPL